MSVTLDAGCHLDVPPEHEHEHEHEQGAVYLVDGELDVDGTAIESAQMAVLDAGTVAQLSSAGDARVMLAGGVPLDGEERFIHWNFVSSSREKIERAQQAWRQQTMDKVPGETKWAPLPDR